jgi:hypothetical protein
MPAGRDRIAHDVADITSSAQLLRYAAAGQLEQLRRQRTDLTQGDFAKGAGFGGNQRSAGSALSAALRREFTAAQLSKLDDILGALLTPAPDMEGTGGLSSLDLRLSADRGRTVKGTSLAVHVPPSWTRAILKDPPPGEAGVLIQASALLSAFTAASQMDKPGISVASVRDRYRDELEQLVRRLVLIYVAPPTSVNNDAQIMLGCLASYAFEQMKGRLEAELRYSPLGFRVWRAITKLVTFSEPEHADALKAWIRRLVGYSEELRKRSLYAGRSLDLELAITVPASWSPPGDDWVGDALRARAWNNDATIRERGTAAMGLWQRSIEQNRPNRKGTEEDLRRLIDKFRDPGTRPDAAAGLRWVAATLEHVIEKQVHVCNEWPDIGEPWFQHVQQAADELDHAAIPDHLLAGTKNLFRHMILQNAGVYRRQAIETVITSGWTEPIAWALEALLRKEENEAWLRIRAEFALGFLQRPSRQVEAALTNACLDAFKRLNLSGIPRDVPPPRSHVTEVHSSLFAIGDCFGVAGAEERARTARETLRDVLMSLANMEGDRARIMRRAARAAAYVLTVTAQSTEPGERDLSQELLEKLSRHPDPVTAHLSQWALSFRFAPDGRVRPLLAAAEHTKYDDDLPR